MILRKMALGSCSMQAQESMNQPLVGGEAPFEKRAISVPHLCYNGEDPLRIPPALRSRLQLSKLVE